jgi:protein phosphatase
MAWNEGFSTIGNRRANEDAYGCDGRVDTFVVADGTGPADVAAFGAAITVNSILSAARDKRSSPPVEALQYGFSQAHKHVQDIPEPRGLGTYVYAAAVVLRLQRLTVAWVGDCRAYVRRDGLLYCLTRDQIWFGSRCLLPLHDTTPPFVRYWTPPEPDTFPNVAHPIGRGQTHTPSVETVEFDWNPSDLGVLCTDGLSATIPHEALEDLLKDVSDPIVASTRLLEASLRAKPHDNVTAIVFSDDSIAFR